MRITRIYQPTTLSENTEIELDARAAHYLLQVLRLPLTSPIIIFNGQGGEFAATLARFEKKKAFAYIEKFNAIDRESPINTHLGIGLMRTEKMDLIIQKATELGVSEITPVITEFSNTKLSHEKKEKRLMHWQNIIISACEQCGRNRLPTLHEPKRFSDFATTQADLKIIFHPIEKTNPLNDQPKNIALLVGSEGGFSPQEIEIGQNTRWQFASLGPRILRAETAAITALSNLQMQFGDLH